MMQKLSVFFLLIAVVCCSTPKKPEGVLTQPQLSALLVDIYLAEVRVDQMPMLRDSTVRFFIPYEEKLLKAKGIPDSVLRKTYAYYLANPKEFEQVYDAVIDTLSVREQRASRLQQPAKKPTPGKPPVE